MYILDFLERVIKKRNIPVLIYLAINLFFIAVILNIVFNNPYWQSFLLAIVLYSASITVALSSMGEWILRLQTGCREIQRLEHRERIEPLFKEVYIKAKAVDSKIPDDVKLFMNNDKEPNAFATGRKTICISEGLLQLPEEQIKAALAHEFAHLAHKDTDLILVVSVGNLIIISMVTVIRLFINVMQFIFGIFTLFLGGSEGALASIINLVSNVMFNIFVIGIMWIWTKLGVLLVMKSSRENEYEADQFSSNLGYGNALCEILDTIGNSGAKGLFANLASSHPHRHDRIAKLQKLGATYRKGYVS